MPKSDNDRESTLLDIRKQGRSAVLYENPRRLLKSLFTVAEVFGKEHEVYVALELTKKNESHFRDAVGKLIEHFEAVTEGSRLKGEATIVIGPYANEKTDTKDFDPLRDSSINVDLLELATRLNEEVEMSEGEFRSLLKSLFKSSNLATDQLNAVVRLVKRQGKKKRMETIMERVGGFI